MDGVSSHSTLFNARLANPTAKILSKRTFLFPRIGSCYEISTSELEDRRYWRLGQEIRAFYPPGRTPPTTTAPWRICLVPFHTRRLMRRVFYDIVTLYPAATSSTGSLLMRQLMDTITTTKPRRGTAKWKRNKEVKSGPPAGLRSMMSYVIIL